MPKRKRGPPQQGHTGHPPKPPKQGHAGHPPMPRAEHGKGPPQQGHTGRPPKPIVGSGGFGA
eukprot:15484603-Alexandrium_andersonii.AAC.1